MINQLPLLPNNFHPFPNYRERVAWQKISEDVKAIYREEADKRKGQKWQSLPASLYMEFYRNGNRSNYEDLFFGRRFDLLILTIAECIEGKGEYIDDIINGVWLICEETTWIIPACMNGTSRHESFLKNGNEEPRLPFPGDDYIDLFSAETGSLLSWVYYFLKDAILLQAPEVIYRIEKEMTSRILVPYLERNFNWMGLDHDNPLSNWNPWINSNILSAYLVFAAVFDRADQGVNKAIKSINRFLFFYTDDGGCDEGPVYFHAAGASLLDFIEGLGIITDVSYLYRDAKIQNMASYLYKVYIAKDYFVNYADAHCRVSNPAGILDRAGKNMGDNVLAAFSAYLKNNKYCMDDNDCIQSRGWFIFRRLSGLFADRVTQENPVFKAPSLAWFPGIQVVTARDETCPKGFFFSAKGGNNNENHNHNDIGNFLLYYDEIPLLIDAGVETYTKNTFSEKRYSLWTMQSCYHNLPSLNGFDQVNGNFAAKNVSLCAIDGSALTSCPPEGIKFSLDIANAYPDAACVKHYIREFTFIPGANLEIKDTYSLESCISPVILNLLCYEKPKIYKNRAELSGVVNMEFDCAIFDAEIEEIHLTDVLIRKNWQKDSLYRLKLISKTKDLSGAIKLKFTPSC